MQFQQVILPMFMDLNPIRYIIILVIGDEPLNWSTTNRRHRRLQILTLVYPLFQLVTLNLLD